MRRLRRVRQQGLALIALMAAFALGATWFLVSQLNAETATLGAVKKQRNAEVLNRAKQALIGYIAAQAAKTGENYPGALPCPEASGNYGNSANEGTVSGSCTTPLTGRFPWKTLGLDKLVDASGEPLWYAVASGWAGGNTVINSNCASYNAASTQACRAGRLTVDGSIGDVIALIIAPGPAFNVAAATGCTAQTQTRPTTGTPDVLNYLECENATSPGNTFVTTGASTSFNDQVITITAAELIPPVEAAIADRIEREIAPLLKNAYAGPNWGLTAGDRVLPYAAPFANPDTASFTGTTATTQGLLPLVHTETYPGSLASCTAGAADPRCNPNLVVWSNPAPTVSYTNLVLPVTSSCTYTAPTGFAFCNGTYAGIGATPRITVSGPQSNGAISLRATNSVTGLVIFSDVLGGLTILQPVPSVSLNSDGTFTVSIAATPPAPPLPLSVVSWWILVPGNATSDHSLLDGRAPTASPAPPSTSWFMRNEWHKLLYYAVAPGYTAAGAAPRSCTTGGTCLSITNLAPSGAQRAMLMLAGRSIDGSARPGTTLSDYFEFGNATGSYERQSVSTVINAAQKAPFNDRFVVVDTN